MREDEQPPLLISKCSTMTLAKPTFSLNQDGGEQRSGGYPHGDQERHLSSGAYSSGDAGRCADVPFARIWKENRICVSHIDGEETSQYMIDRCLMRPRGLIDIVKYCRSYAGNHARTSMR